MTDSHERALNGPGPRTSWYETQQEHLLGWLREYEGPGYYNRAKWDRTAEFATTSLTPSAGHPLGIGTIHTLLMAWEPATHNLTFQLDDATPVVVDPTTLSDPHMSITAPVVQAKRVDYSFFNADAFIAPASPAGATGSISAQLSNICFQ